MIKITVLETPYLDAVSYWRLFRPLQVMRVLYPGTFEVEFKEPQEKLNYADAAFTDVIINVRPGRYPKLNDYLEKAFELGKAIIGDLDDDTNDLPINHSLAMTYEKQNNVDPATGLTPFERAKKFTKWWWYSTPYLLDKYGNGEVIPNAVLPSELPAAPCPDRGWFAWRGREVQVHDLNVAGQVQYDAIREASNAMFFIGYLPPIQHGSNVGILPKSGDLTEFFEKAEATGEKPVILMPRIDDVDKYMRQIRAMQFNAFWKPLNACGFNDAKSNIAWIEATLAGGVCITNYAGRPGWEFATDKPLPYDAACEVWRQSREHIHKNYNLVHAAQQRAECIFRLLGLNTAADAQK
jgi:hypothetical protein